VNTHDANSFQIRARADEMEPPSPSTPLISLPAAAIDSETTGLDPRSARMVQIAAIRLQGGEIEPAAGLQMLVDPGVAIPEASAAIHGIRDADIAGAPDFAKAWEAFNDYTGARVLIGYRTGFDISVFKRECGLAGIEWRERHWLCVQVLARLVSSTPLAIDSLESLSDWLGVSIRNRHTALGDAQAAAGIWAGLIPLLRQKGIRTLGEALAATGQLLNDGSQELARQSAGIEADVSALRPERPPVRIDSYAYRRRLADVMSAPPVFAPAAMSLRDAARLILEKRVSSVLVEDDHGRIGIATERDLLRAITAEALGGVPATLGGIMSHPLHGLSADTHLYRAIGRMNRLNVRHLAVTNGEGRPVGVVTPRNLLRARANEAIILGDQIEAVTDGAGLAAARAKLTALAKGLLEDELDARNICAVVSAELCNLTRRAAQIAESRMQAAGRGAPPVPYAVMVLGSGGRGESLLVPDQDNAIVYERGEPGGAEDRWFAELGTHIADLLDQAGVPYCTGGIMAKNEAWRKSREGWLATIDGWVRKSRPEDLLNVDIFFDGVPVHGATELAEEIWRHAYLRAHGAPAFQTLLTELSRNWRPPLGVFGGFRSDKGDRTDLKRGGLMPIFTGARVLSIKHRLLARSSAERLRAAVAVDVMGSDAAETVIAAHETILRCILAQQLDDTGAGVPLSNLVETGKLSARERRRLRQAIRDIAILMDVVSEARF
jgi:DNA polymerase-3 subunit epsilon/CBS domain-containing protein